jgi:hypothetical protein
MVVLAAVERRGASLLSAYGYHIAFKDARTAVRLMRSTRFADRVRIRQRLAFVLLWRIGFVREVLLLFVAQASIRSSRVRGGLPGRRWAIG